MPIAALIVAAGRGTRAGGEIPKQYARLDDLTVLAHTVRAFEAAPEIAEIVVVIQPSDLALYEASVPRGIRKLRAPVAGGATRQASVRAGLDALAAINPSRVLIHDAARPFLVPETIASVVSALVSRPGAIAAMPLADTLKRADEAGAIAATLDRSGLWAAQTPQGFHFSAILAAHRAAAAAGRDDFTDDAAVAEWAGLSVALVEGPSTNFKITTAADLERARQLLSAGRRAKEQPSSELVSAVAAAKTGPSGGAVHLLEPRTGTGFDVHRFAPGNSVWLCGVEIPHDARLDGHSDADVGLHALTDAILGALGDGDIGQHFPPSDPQWKGAASHLFLRDAARRVAERGGRIINVDVTLLCEAPRVGPHRDAMRQAIAAILGIDTSRVGVKATTTEGLGFTGRREGIAAIASATVAVAP